MRAFAAFLSLALAVAGCSGSGPGAKESPAKGFGPAVRAGRAEAISASPNLRVGPDGKLYMVWLDQEAAAAGQSHASHGTQGAQAPAPAPRTALMAVSADGGKTWSEALRINDQTEDVQGDENLPKLAFGANNRLYSVWSIPNAKGDKMRANIRFSTQDAAGKFSPAVTLNDLPDIARFPAMDVAPDGTVHVVWIDRRVDGPAPRAIYMTRMDPTGKILASNQKIGGPSCECCKVTMAFAEQGKRVHIAYRQKTEANIRDIVVQTSTDGGATFGDQVVISPDGWKIEACPHSGPVLATDPKGNLHVTWFTQGSKPEEAGLYYTVSKDGGRTFAPRKLVQKAGGPGVLRSYLAVGEKGDVHLAWDNYESGKDTTQIFYRHLSADGETMSPVQQITRVDGNALRPNLAVSKEQVFLAWTEAKGDRSWIMIAAAPVPR